MGKTIAPEVVIWTDHATAPVLGQLMDLMASAVKPIAVGGPRGAAIHELATALDCPSHDDARHMIVAHPAPFVLIGGCDLPAAEHLSAACDNGSVILTTSTPADSLQQLKAIEQATVRGQESRLVYLPAFTQSPGMMSSTDPQQAVTQVRSLAMDCTSAPGEASLYSLLFDAWISALAFVSMPDSIDAALVTQGNNAIGDSLHQLAGDMGVHARIADQVTLVMRLSDQSARFSRSLHIIDAEAQIIIHDHGYELLGKGRGVLEQSPPQTSQPTYVDLMARQWRRLLDRPGYVGTQSPGPGLSQAIACCRACWLSCRTGDPESPVKLLEMDR